ncbi:DENN domain-containing protein 3-like isoform X2 [Lytechinus variegatus]|uniref:DENN domain-containing protein 3-like isoform X2 n=1 Tax=Lytechinus variegatus TaxID=7654 RepID=UPI001BB12DCD|nr:DENN domain-containing protein 3-like isoform X2 [Lytechinus variegatus]
MSGYDDCSSHYGSGGSEREKEKAPESRGTARLLQQRGGAPPPSSASASAVPSRLKPKLHLNISLAQQHNEKSHSADDIHNNEAGDKLGAIVPTLRLLNKWRQSAKDFTSSSPTSSGTRPKLTSSVSLAPNSGMSSLQPPVIPASLLSPANPVATPKLPNALIEMCVVVGMDDDTGLKVAKKSMAASQFNFRGGGDGMPIFSSIFEPHVLAVLTRQMAVFPQNKSLLNDGYSEYPRTPVVTPPGRDFSPGGFPYVRQRRMARRLSIKPRALPLSYNQEMINSLPPLCFPGDASVSKGQREESFHYLVLTSLSGTRSYATCLTFYRQFIVHKYPDEDFYSLEPKTSTTVQNNQKEGHEQVMCYVPACIVLISPNPYFTVMRECLSSLVPDLYAKPQKMNELLKEFTLQLLIIPTPPAGNLYISFMLNEFTISIPPPDDPEKPVVNISLHLPFLIFTLDDILKIISAILTQQRIIFLSHDYSLLVPIMECFFSYILPFKWPFVYVPVVSTQLLDLLEAPGCFIMGCNTIHRSRIQQIEGLVIADIEKGTLHECPTLSVPSLPKGPTEGFKKQFYHARVKYYELATLGRTVPATLEMENARRQKMDRQFQQEILDCFLEMFVHIFRELPEFMSMDQRWFKLEEFVSSRAEEERDFYNEMVHSQIFKPFREDRLDQKKDYYAQMEKKIRPPSLNVSSVVDQGRIRKQQSTGQSVPDLRRRRVSGARSLSETGQSSSDQTAQFMLPLFHIPYTSDKERGEDIKMIEFPSKKSAQHFFTKCIEQLDHSIESCRQPALKASYLYLRGMFHIACNSPLDALDDFHNLHTADLSILPTDLITELMDNLSAEDKDLLHRREFYKRGEILRKISERRSAPQITAMPSIQPDDLPDKGELGLREFIHWMQYLEIAIDVDVIDRLFNALSSGSSYLDAETFIYFYEAWKEGLEEIKSIPLSIYKEYLDSTESVLKMSSLIRTDHGMGRLVLTEKRLFYMGEGSNIYREIVRTRDIEKLEKFEYFNILLSCQALRIYSTKPNTNPYVANLKAERNSWFTLITELWAGRVISDAQKDPQVVQQAARNVKLIDSVIRSAENEDATHAKHLDSAVWHLCHFSRLKDEGMGRVPPETSSALVHKFNPSSNEAQRTTVEAMIYTPGNRSMSELEEATPKLWCAMGSGKVKVFDGSNFVLEAEFADAKDRVCCLLCVRGEQVWAGSFDTTIYIIDIPTCLSNKQLVEHNDIVSDMTVSEDGKTAFTCSLNGQIFGWDTQSLSQKHQIQLKNTKTLVSMKFYNDKLWCCTKTDIRVLGLDGNELNSLQHLDKDGMPSLIESFLLLGNRIWTGCGRRGEVACWNVDSFKQEKLLTVSCRGLSKLVSVGTRIWAGSKQGKIHLFDANTCEYEKELEAHEDAIRSMCQAEMRYVITGAGSKDGKVALWRANFVAN